MSDEGPVEWVGKVAVGAGLIGLGLWGLGITHPGFLGWLVIVILLVAGSFAWLKK